MSQNTARHGDRERLLPPAPGLLLFGAIRLSRRPGSRKSRRLWLVCYGTTPCEVGELLISAEGSEVKGPQEHARGDPATSGGRVLSSARGGPP